MKSATSPPVRRAFGQPLVEGIGRDLQVAARRLARVPAFTAFSVLSLAIGIAITTSIFAVIYSLLWRAAGVPEPHRMAVLVAPFYGSGLPGWRNTASLPDFIDLRAQSRAVDELVASATIYQPLLDREVNEVVPTEAVSGAYFNVLGVNVASGRRLQPGDDVAGAPAVAVMNHRLWRTRFAADAGIVGRTVRIGGHPFEIVGIMDAAYEGLNGLAMPTQLWVTFAGADYFAGNPDDARVNRDRRQLTVLGEIAPGRDIAEVGAEMAGVSRGLDAVAPVFGFRDASGVRPQVARGWTARRLSDIYADSFDLGWRFGWLVIALVGMVLAVACTNLANLTLARGSSRQHEWAIRRAIGASGWRLVREQMFEAGLIALGGLAAGVALAKLLTAWFTTEIPIAPAVVTALEPRLDGTALGVAGLSALVSMLVMGVWPALQLARDAARHGQLNGVDHQSSPRWRAQRSLISWQVAVSSAFFLIAALIGKAIVAEARHDSGVDVDQLAIGYMNLDLLRFDRVRALRVIDVLSRQPQPGLESMTISTGLPFGFIGTPSVSISTPDRPIVSEDDSLYAPFIAATPGVFDTIGVPIVSGRAFDHRDVDGGRQVIVLSEAIARKLFGTTDVLERDVIVQVRARGGPPTPVMRRTVIGIAGDTDTERLFSRRTGAVYAPLAQHYQTQLAVIARTEDPTATAAGLGLAARRADPDLALSSVMSGPMLLAPIFVLARIAAIAAVGLGALALVLAMTGLYGVLSHLVARRRREVGVRMALGASADRIARMIMREGFRPVLEGLVLGLVAGAIGRLIVRAVLNPDLSLIDPLVFALVPLPLCLAAFLACYMPARRASRVSPNQVLRDE
ncbi:MAG TPA: ABC transporter permease [Vicinamibacterales bacterium]|nr:ABC transporter permease [Vicinamibacterales bacterium]